jgi:hypothetical protein
MSFADGVQARARKLIARGQTLDGRLVSVHEVEYSQTIAGVGNTGVVVDIGGSGQGAGAASIGFANEADAIDYLTTADAQEYTVFDRNGGRITETRVGLGIPDGMIRFVNQEKYGRVAPVAAAVVPPNAAQYPDAAAALNSPPDAASQSQGSLSGEGAQANATVNTRVGGDPGAAREALTNETSKTDPKHDGDGNDSGPKNDKDKNKS